MANAHNYATNTIDHIGDIRKPIFSVIHVLIIIILSWRNDNSYLWRFGNH